MLLDYTGNGKDEPDKLSDFQVTIFLMVSQGVINTKGSFNIVVAKCKFSLLFFSHNIDITGSYIMHTTCIGHVYRWNIYDNQHNQVGNV